MTPRFKRGPLLWLVLLLVLPPLGFCAYWLGELRDIQHARQTLLPETLGSSAAREARAACGELQQTLARLEQDDAPLGLTALNLRQQRQRLDRHWRDHRHSIVAAEEIVLQRQVADELRRLDAELVVIDAALAAGLMPPADARHRADRAITELGVDLARMALARVELQRRQWQQMQDELDQRQRQLLWRLGAVVLLQLALAGWLFLPPLRARARSLLGQTLR